VKTHVLNIIDTKTFTHVGDITLPGNHSEAMAIDHAGKKLYVNLTGVNKIGVVDLQSRQSSEHLAGAGDQENEFFGTG